MLFVPTSTTPLPVTECAPMPTTTAISRAEDWLSSEGPTITLLLPTSSGAALAPSTTERARLARAPAPEPTRVLSEPPDAAPAPVPTNTELEAARLWAPAWLPTNTFRSPYLLFLPAESPRKTLSLPLRV